MFRTIATLMGAAQNRADDRLRDAFAIELIDQKLREAEAGVRSAKTALAGLIQRQRGEERQLQTLRERIADLTARARAALAAGEEDLAAQAAGAIAEMENETALRETTLRRLNERILRLRHSVELGHRRMIDLRQGATQARAVRREQEAQMRMGRVDPANAAREAEELIARVIGRDDPFEEVEILREIEAGLDHHDIADRLGDRGYGAVTRATQSSVLDRLRAGDTRKGE